MAKLTRREKTLRREAVGIDIGERSEQRFDAAFRDLRARTPGWFYGFRKASRQEDNGGIDRFAVIDLGEVAVQIKTSEGQLERYRYFHPDLEVIIVVMKGLRSPYNIRAHTLSLLAEYRKARMPPDWRDLIEPIRVVK